MNKKEAFISALAYFKGDELAAKVWVDKYALKNNKGEILESTPDDMHRRMAAEFARIENNHPNPMPEDEIYYLFKDFKYIIPQGSPMAGIGNNHQTTSLSNCFVIPSSEDSYGGIMKTDQEQVQLMKRRGGVGHDLSSLRPSGSKANGSVLGSDCGMTLFMERFSNSTREVAQDGRRGALMLSVSVKHPDVDKFIDSKLKDGKVTGANISVRITDEFMRAVETDDVFVQTFPVENNLTDIKFEGVLFAFECGDAKLNELYEIEENAYVKFVKARDIWNQIIFNAHQSAEPGILFWDKILSESPARGYGEEWKEISTNPCSEIALPKYDSCRLMAINLFSYVQNPFASTSYFDGSLFKEHVLKAQRLMDDLVDLEIEKIDKIISKIWNDPEDSSTKEVEFSLWNNIKKTALKGRRTGLGITAEGDMLAALGIVYGSPEAIGFVEEVHKTMAKANLESSIQLAKERGCFLDWDFESDSKSEYLRRIFMEIGISSDYINHGRRNIATMTIAPTGTVSLMTQTTSGIEPAFQLSYKRRRRVEDKNNSATTDSKGDHWEDNDVIHHKFAEWFDKNWFTLDPSWFDLDYKPELTHEFVEKIKPRSPYKNSTSSEIDYLGKVRMQGAIQKWVDHSISVTVNMPENVTKEQVSQVYFEAWRSGCKGVTVYREGSRDGVLISKETEKQQAQIVYRDAPKREAKLECHVYNKTALGKPWTIFIGLQQGKPYEIFAINQLANHELNRDIEKGYIEKVGKKHYRFTADYKGKKYVIENIIDKLGDDEKVETRRYSNQLRHGIRPDYIVAQINKYAIVTSFDKVIARCLSNHLTLKSDSGNKCPECGGKVNMVNGCLTCIDCGFAKCG